MAGTPDSWKTANIAQNPGRLYRGLAVPGAGARLTLFADNTPDITANPNAKHMGATKAGAKLMVKGTLNKFPVDEFRAPVVTNLDSNEMGISAELVGVTDMQLMEFLTPGVGTRSTAAGYDQLTIGARAIVYDSIALIFPLVEDVTKVGVFHVYSGLNDSGVEWAVGRKELGFTPVSIVAYELTTRAAGDTLGNWWKQI